MTTTTMHHTPGPWRVDIDCRMIETGLAGNLRGEYEHICDFRPDINGHINEANARLIAAAPELLEAVKTLLTMESIMLGNRPSAVYTIERAKAAIARAEGGPTP